ncbi:MAG: BirA family biotin operon repressor/biotin-[acetyl-CoA-carboxylase] ligase [Psychromonas sp.]|jgi:BirA family biotin operon repressor/biotin-[acetyl-CoA-carboxylase] ligase
MIGKKVIHLESVDSTNNYAANMLKTGRVEHGTVIMADEQTNGRGQAGNAWQSAPGMNLQLSLVLMPQELKLKSQHSLSQVVSVSLVKLLRSKGLESQIKWPNDIFIKDHKIAGILIENQIKGQDIKSSIVGVGINVNQSEFKELNATSFFLETGVKSSISELLLSWVYHFNLCYKPLSIGQFEEVKKEYYSMLLGYRSLRRFEDKNGVFAGIIEGVDEYGKLLLFKEGVEQSYDLKEIKFMF